jgi:hypothetical protein
MNTSASLLADRVDIADAARSARLGLKGAYVVTGVEMPRQEP